MIPTLAQVASLIRNSYLMDTETTGGTPGVGDNTSLLGYESPSGAAVAGGPLAIAYNQMMKALLGASSPRLYRHGFWDLPAYSNRLLPSIAGLTNVGEVTDIWDRSLRNTVLGSGISSVTIVSPSSGSNTAYTEIVTSAPHPFTTGQYLLAMNFQGLSDDINGEWAVVCPDTTHIRLMGAQPVGSYTPSSGRLSDSSEAFPEAPNLQPTGEIDDPSTSANASNLSQWSFWNGYLRFIPCASDRQLKIRYMLSSVCPIVITASTGVDDCETFLACYAAGIIHQGRGQQQSAQRLFMQAVGNATGEVSSPSGGLLGEMCRANLRQQQVMGRIRMQPFRPARNRAGVNRY